MTGFLTIVGIWVVSLNERAVRQLFKRCAQPDKAVPVRGDEAQVELVDAA